MRAREPGKRAGMRIACCLLAASMPAAALAQEGDKARSGPIIVTAPGGAIDLDDALSLEREDVWRTGAPTCWHRSPARSPG